MGKSELKITGSHNQITIRKKIGFAQYIIFTFFFIVGIAFSITYQPASHREFSRVAGAICIVLNIIWFISLFLRKIVVDSEKKEVRIYDLNRNIYRFDEVRELKSFFEEGDADGGMDKCKVLFILEHGLNIDFDTESETQSEELIRVLNPLLFADKAVHHMKLQNNLFEMVKSGKKTIELRLFDEKRQKIKEGDQIVFTSTTTGETLHTTVVKLHRFDNFDELYKSLPLLQCGYTPETIDKATPADMQQYYSAEAQKEYGVVGIEIFKNVSSA